MRAATSALSQGGSTGRSSSPCAQRCAVRPAGPKRASTPVAGKCAYCPSVRMPRWRSWVSASVSRGSAVGRLAGQEGALGCGDQQQRRVLRGDLPRHAGAELAARGAQRRLPAQAADVGRQRLAPVQEFAFDAGRVARRRSGCGVQVDPAQAVRLPAVGVVLDAGEELFLGLPEREARGGQQRGVGTMRRRLPLAQAERDAGPRGRGIRRQHPAVRVEQDQRPVRQPRLRPPRHVRAEMRRPQEGDLALDHAPPLRRP